MNSDGGLEIICALPRLIYVLKPSCLPVEHQRTTNCAGPVNDPSLNSWKSEKVVSSGKWRRIVVRWKECESHLVTLASFNVSL